MYKCPICDKQRSIDLQYPIIDGVTNFTFCTDCYNETRRNYWLEQNRIENNCWGSNFDETCNKDNFSLWLEAIAYTRECHQFELLEV